MGTFVGTFTLTTPAPGSSNSSTFGFDPGHYYQLATHDGTGSYDLSGACFSLDGGAPVSWAGLPAGFTPTNGTCTVQNVTGNNSGVLGFVQRGSNLNVSTAIVTWGPFSETKTSTSTGVQEGIPILGANTLTTLELTNTMTIELTTVLNTGGDASLTAYSIDALKVTGSYTLVATWYYNPTTDHYEFLVSDPGAPWIPQNPTLTITSISPSLGSPCGGDLVTIRGTGFGDGATVTIGGVPLTSVIVVNSTTITGLTGVHAPGTVNVVVTNPDLTTATLVNGFTYGAVSVLHLPTMKLYTFACHPPAYRLPFDIFADSIFYPAGTIFNWVVDVTPPTDTGWWLSSDEEFGGAAFIVNDSRPKDPRAFQEIGAFATGSTGMMGGFPGPSCIFKNHLIYAEGLYTVGTTSPVIRVFDGQFDRPLTSLPNTASGAVPKAVMSMIAANGTIYLATLETGSSDANWTGRVFSLDFESGELAPIGSGFSAEVPYSLAWHAGRLWLGTMVQTPTNSGHIYFFRPDIDTAWTNDHTLSANSMAGCSSLLSFQGNLYVGCTAAVGTFAKVLVRDTLGAYSTADTGSGGAAKNNNGYLALAEFHSKLYASYWNPDTPAVSIIRKSSDGASWSTAYTGAGGTLVPYIGFPTDGTVLLGLGGGLTYAAALVSTTDGTSWSDRTPFLTQGSPTSTGAPVFGVVYH